jgi:antitoxin MazE
MSTVVKTRVVKIGNSRGIRIPRLLIDQLGLGEEVELAVQEHQLVVRPLQGPRYGWEEQFRLMAERGDDRLLDEGASTSRWDEEEWEWS